MLTLGAAIMLWLLPGPQAIGSVIFDYHTLLFGAMSVLIGFQSINFAAFTKIFAIADASRPNGYNRKQDISLRHARNRIDLG